jgi:GT2 family glycosyltransferase
MIAPMTGEGPPWRIAVVIATIGRPVTVRRCVERLARQTRAADLVMVVGVQAADAAGQAAAGVRPEVFLAPRGLCRQRNHALDRLAGRCDLVIFFDDDYLPADDFIATAERLFAEQPDLVGATGRMIADGALGPGLGFDEAVARLEADRLDPDPPSWTRPIRALYGCNMVYRAAAIGTLRFDETLPLYGWQEDIDFSYQMARRGRLLKCDALAGVHLGEKAGRTSGKRLGYSQIANPIYLLKKGTIPPDLARRLMRGNLASNLLRSIRPEPYIDRRGRLAGNLLALIDLPRGRLDPRRVLEL